MVYVILGILVFSGTIIVLVIKYTRVTPEKKNRENRRKFHTMVKKGDIVWSPHCYMAKEYPLTPDDCYSEEEPMNKEGIEKVESERDAIKRRRKNG